MNIHHVELFYYVARHGGISRAVRNMPYGIQQPAVSSQILQLEDDLGVKLFVRNPFKLTTAGEELYAFCQPFFDQLHPTAERLRRQSAPSLRIGATEIVLRDYLPLVIERLRAEEPGLRLGLRSGLQPQVETWLLEREIDLGIVPLEQKPSARLQCLSLLKLPLVLLVHRDSPLQSADELWERDTIDEALICQPPIELISKTFRAALKARDVDWPHTIEASSMGLVTRYVANGYGIGVSLAAGEAVTHPDVRVLPLSDFGEIEIVLLWTKPASPLVQHVVDAAPSLITRHWPELGQ